MSAPLHSDRIEAIEWSDTLRFAQDYGVKAANCLAIPRAWTLPFLSISFEDAANLAGGTTPVELSGAQGAALLSELAGEGGELIVRSSVIGESIWDRGTYESVPFALDLDNTVTARRLMEAAERALRSSEGRPSGLMLQRFLRPASQGEFGNLQRVSKTRDHWEIATREADGITSRSRLNSQRDSAADPEAPLAARVGLARERLFGAFRAQSV